MSKLYYTPPTDEQFNDVKNNAMELWKEVAHDESYANEKIGAINDIQNVQDNFMYMVAMFDDGNQKRLANKLSPETCVAIRERLIDGGSPEYLINF